MMRKSGDGIVSLKHTRLAFFFGSVVDVEVERKDVFADKGGKQVEHNSRYQDLQSRSVHPCAVVCGQ